MSIERVAAWVTVLTAPVAVTGVALVWLQLRRMQADATGAQQRRAAATLPLIDALLSHIEGGWGCDIIDNPTLPPNDDELARYKADVEIDFRLAEDLRTRSADAGVRQVVLASMIEADLRVCLYYLASVRNSVNRAEKWELRWPSLVREIHRLREFSRQLESVFSTPVPDLKPAERAAFRAMISNELNARLKPQLATGLAAKRVEWPPPSASK